MKFYYLIILNIVYFQGLGQQIVNLSDTEFISIERDERSFYNLSKKQFIQILGDTITAYSPIQRINITSPALKKNKSRESLTAQQDASKVNRKAESIIIFDSASALPKYYSLFIGVNDYEYKNENLLNLNSPISDAEKLQTILSEKFIFQKSLSQFLKNPTRQEIINAFESLAKVITPRDNLLIFYAGHGVWDTRIKIGYWLASNAEATDKSNWISNSTIRDYIAGINSKHTLLITDACFGGSILKTRKMSLSPYGMSNLYKYQSRKAMTSGTLTSVPDQSKFMYYMLKRLAEIEDDYTSSRQLFFSLETAVINNTTTIPQFGVIHNTGDEGGDFIFIKKQPSQYRK